MNTVDLKRLKEKEDAAIKIIDSWPRIFQLLIYRQLYAFGIRISNIDSEIEKELKKSALNFTSRRIGPATQRHKLVCLAMIGFCAFVYSYRARTYDSPTWKSSGR